MTSQPPRALFPHELLAEMLVPEYAHVYVLGSFARYATIYSQQVRAINLIDALCRSGSLAQGVRVAVVGGSTGGLTAAVAAARRGATVSVFEKAPFLFPIQRNPPPRFLHPHIYDWPLDSLGSGSAGLPVLDWDADEAQEVFGELEKAWDLEAKALGIGPVKMNTELVGVHMKADMPVLEFEGGSRIETDIAILAIGFGAELDRPDLHRYWQGDPLDTDLTGATVLVSGDGDGALTDLMRLCIQDFKHEHIVNTLAGHESLVRALRELLASSAAGNVRSVFEDVRKKTEFSLSRHVRLRDGVKVILNAPDNYLDSTKSSILNRFIIYLLEQEGRFERKRGKLGYPIPAHDPVSGQYEVTLDDDGRIERVRCQRLLVRHGPERDEADASRPKHWRKLATLWNACAPLRDRWNAKVQGSDRTLSPIFSNADYDASTARPVVRARPTAADPAVMLRCFVLESSSAPAESVGSFIKDVLEAHAPALGRALQRDVQPSQVLTVWEGVNNAVADGTAFSRTVAHLNSADVAILDVTGFEPGVMLLLGIRSVLRQGVTLITTHERFDAHHWSLLPFNLKELYPLYIKPDTYDINSPSHPFQWLGRTIADALTELRALPQYQDSPAHEDVRRLGPSATYFGRVPAEKGILWLCPFASGYSEEFGSRVQVAVKKAFGLDVPFQRITEIISPQLVSQRLYSSMRRRDLSVVDWTTWSANVFYELGVRLAVNRFSTVSILAGGIEGSRGGKPLSDEEREQRRRLVKLLAPIEYGSSPGAAAGLSEIKERHDRMLQCATDSRLPVAVWGDIPFDHVYQLIARLSSPAATASKQDVEVLLQSQAGMLIGTGGTTNFSSPVLYADSSSTLAEDAKARATEMLLAAWFYSSERLGFKTIQHGKLDNPEYQAQVRNFLDLGERIIALLSGARSHEDLEFAEVMKATVDSLRKEMRKGTDHVRPRRSSPPF